MTRSKESSAWICISRSVGETLQKVASGVQCRYRLRVRMGSISGTGEIESLSQRMRLERIWEDSKLEEMFREEFSLAYNRSFWEWEGRGSLT